MAGPPAAQIGDVLPSFDSKHARSIHFDGKSRYLFLVFSPKCEVCVGEYPKWRQVARHANSKAYRVISLTIYSEGDGGEQNSHIDDNIDEVALPNMALQRAYRVVAVPVVMLASAEGRVQWVHYGHLSEEKVSELVAEIDGKSR